MGTYTVYSGIMYVREKAVKGILEKICIKDVIVPPTADDVASALTYIDTLNGVWTPEELVDYPTAVILVETYLNNRLEALGG